SVIVAEGEFERMFPWRSGYSLALVEAPAGLLPAGLPPAAGRPDRVAMAVAAAWADAAVSVQTARARFASLSAVQNTFLAGFQSLGTLGLLLGTAGLAAVQFARVLERRGQLGLLRAIGFGAGRVRNLIVIETLLMVVLGLAVGAVAGVIAILPSLASGRAAVPVGWIGATCGLTLFVGLAAGLVAARRAARLALREALQPD
ncbi:MAG: ABC transporter permease, partial [Planctomycetota bacterium]